MIEQSSPWLALEWSTWTDFADANFRHFTTGPGLYRVRASEGGKIVYVGQTGRSLRARLQALRTNVLKEEMPWNDPHTAAPCLWAMRMEGCTGYQCAAAAFPDDFQTRKAIECWLIWRHRCETGESPAANFGRMPAGYSKSKNRSTGQRGAWNAIIADNKPCALPLPMRGLCIDSDWMGLDWSQWEPLTAHIAYGGASIYRIRSPGASILHYIGETKTLHARIAAHARRLGSSLEVSYVTITNMDKAGRLEFETDLIGAHLESTERPPVLQFNGKQELGIGQSSGPD